MIRGTNKHAEGINLAKCLLSQERICAILSKGIVQAPSHECKWFFVDVENYKKIYT